jgi:energy-coupling factor transport system permease protein
VNPFLYQEHDTWLHRLDPRTKLAGLLGCFVLAFVFTNPAYVAPSLVLILLTAARARALGNVWRTRFILVPVTLISLVLWTFSVQGSTPLLWEIETESVLFALAVAMRIDAAIIAGIVFLSTTSVTA